MTIIKKYSLSTSIKLKYLTFDFKKYKLVSLISNSVLLSLLISPSFSREKITNDIPTLYSKSSESKPIKKPQINTQYILGPGDNLAIEVESIPEYSGYFTIGPDGYIYLPEIREVNASGLTINELIDELKVKYSKYIKKSDIYIKIIGYRPLRVYVKGEVNQPGYYTLSGVSNLIENQDKLFIKDNQDKTKNFINTKALAITAGNSNYLFPTVFDAIRASQGITQYPDLSEIYLIRENSKSNGGGKIKTKLNFLALLTEGNQEGNIRILDGDTIIIPKSDKKIKSQILDISNSNLNPDYIQVFITGNVVNGGPQTLQRGTGLIQAIASTGGKKLLSGKIEFLRFSEDGSLERRLFSYNPNSKLNSTRNPILLDGDVINVRQSLLGVTSAVIGEVTRPAIGIYSFYNIYDDIRK
tara:strand:- start:25 stop:1263 length:1239 start_codon:yes stop_codon:yes gene_type:complete